MNKNACIIIISIIFLATAVNGCSVDKVSAPVPNAAAGTPATVRVALSSSSIASSGTAQVTATVTDASSTAVPRVTVTFTVVSASSGSCVPVTAVTDASGVAITQFNAAAVNSTAVIRATVTAGTTQVSGSAPITIGTPPLVPASIMVSLGTASIAASGNTTVSATVKDAAGAVISGMSVTFSVSNTTAGNFTSGTVLTNASGVATNTFTANAVNVTVTITASVGALNNSATLTIGTPPPPVPASMTLSSTPLSVNILGQSTVSATLLTSTGLPANNATVTFTISSGTSLGSFSAAGSQLTITAVTNASGIASTTFYAGSSSGVVNIQGSATGVPSQNVSVNITSAPASISVSAANPSLLNGQTTNITAMVRNVMNNPVSDGTTVTFTISAGATNAGSLSSVTATTVNGVAAITFTADLQNSGSLVITATSDTISATVLVTVSAAATQSLEFVSATPSVIGVYGSGIPASSLVTFIARDANGTPKANVSVAFTLYGPLGSTLASPSSSTGSDGKVSANLQAGTVAGPARIVATATLPGGGTISTSSGNISIGGGVPSDRFFSVAVKKFNLDGLNCDGVESILTAYLADRFGNYNILQGTSVSFATDAGAIDTSNVTDALGVATSVYRTQNPRPTDVTPAAWETAAGLSYVDGTGRTRNPRDGYISILISTTGEEYFDDANANGVYDSGETFTDLAEPFIDSNDNGVHDTTELFFDWPGGATGVPGATAGVYNNANGVWDAKLPIFRNMNLVITGPPDFGTHTSRIESKVYGTGAVTITAGASEIFYVYVSDINLNTPIGGTVVSLAADDPAAMIIPVGVSDIIDQLSTGLSVQTYQVKNNTASPKPISVTLLATYNWPGTCGALKTTISYPAVVTLRPIAPAAPAITATAGPGAGEITLQWAPVTGADSYNLYWGTAPGLTVNKISSVTSAYVHTGRTSTVKYYYTATAVNTGGESVKSGEVNAIAP